MLRDVLFIARKELRFSLRGRETLIWTFAMPILFFWFIGTVTAGFAGGGGTPAVALWEEGETGHLGDRLARAIEAQGYAVVTGDSLESFRDYHRLVTLPAGFTDSVAAGRPVDVAFRNRSEGLDRSHHDLRVGRAVYGLLADVVVAGLDGEGPTPAALARIDSTPL